MVNEMESIKNMNNNNSVANAAAYQMSGTNSQMQQHSPQSVGIEFVRQYYTMLNRAPHLLFRFYSDDSLFVRGYLDKQTDTSCIRGQKQINAKICSLNFKNCHTKIRQVDAMETLGNGVVIQVTGDLSNDGQPLRRFLQTFVLTPQPPNKYYVRNDIFRYQDEFGEENEESIEKNDVEAKIENNSEGDNYQSIEPNEKDFSSYQSNGSSIPHVAADAVVPVEEENAINEEETDSIQEASIEVNASIADASEMKEQIEEEEEQEAERSVTDSTTNVSQQYLSNEPKTYASMLSKNFNSAGIAAVPTAPSKPVPPLQQPQQSQPPMTVNNFVSASVPNEVTSISVVPSSENVAVAAPAGNVSKNTGFPPQRDRFVKKSGFSSNNNANNNNNRRNESRESAKNDSDSGEGESLFPTASTFPKKQFPDENQLFIGNLLPNFCENDLYEIFGKYGKILEVRINRQTHKTNSNKASRNYGFITFENPEIVDQIIAQKPIYHNHHRYNVEKKQGKSATSSFDRPPRTNLNNSSGSNNNNGPRIGAQPNLANAPLRHMPVNTGGGPGNQGSGNQRPRTGQGYNSASNTGNRNFTGSQNYANRNTFNHQQQPPQIR